MLIVVCFIQNDNGDYLIQYASKEKGNYYGTTSGHPKAGEDSIDGMHTEIYEELGIDIPTYKYQYVNTFTGFNKIVDLYYIKENINISSLTLQKEEVEKVIWMSQKEIEDLIKEEKFEKIHSKLFKDLLNWLQK